QPPPGELVQQTGRTLQHGEKAQQLQQSLHDPQPRPCRGARTSSAGREAGPRKSASPGVRCAESLHRSDFGRRSGPRESPGASRCVDLSTVKTDEGAPGTALFPSRRWLLPSALVSALDPEAQREGGRRPRRTVRDWIVDFTCFLIAVFIGLLSIDSIESADLSPGLQVADQLIGALACGAVWLRRRWPLGLAVAMLPVSYVSVTAGGASLIALFTLAVHRPFRYVAWVAGIDFVAQPLYYWLRPEPGLPYIAAVLFTWVLIAAVAGWGMFVRSKRQLLLSLRDQARRAETEARLRAEQAQRLAREAIAREMHDVLAHRLTLLSVHAGALEFRPDAPREEIARAAGVIRESAHEALQDLREIIGVLRAGENEDAGRPQPTLAALDA